MRIFARVCSVCSKGMNKGYLCCDETFCSEACLSKSFEYTYNSWAEHYEAMGGDDGSCYYTEWEEIDAGDDVYDEKGNVLFEAEEYINVNKVSEGL